MFTLPIVEYQSNKHQRTGADSSIYGWCGSRSILRGAIAVILFVLSGGALASDTISIQFPICQGSYRVTCIVDGDTLWLHQVKYRLRGIDTPELDRRRQCGGYEEFQLAKAARARLQQILSDNLFSVSTYGKDRYGRTLAQFHIGNTTAGEMLISEEYARRRPDGRKFWCR